MSTNYDMEPLPPTDPCWWAIVALIVLAACVLSLSYCHV